MRRDNWTHRATTVLLCGALTGTAVLSTGCTGNAAADGGIVGAGAGALTFIGLKAAGVKDGAAAGIAAGVGLASGVITFFTSDAKYKREASEAEEQKAREEAARVAERDRQQNRPRNDDYYVPVSSQDGDVALQKIDHQTQEPKGDVLIYSEADLQNAQTNGQTVKIDGHEVAGQL